MVETFTKTYNPMDTTYKANRRKIIKELSTQSTTALKEQLDFLASQPPPRDDDGVAQSMYHNIRTLEVPRRVKGILDSTSGTTGSVLIRQDLEPIIHILFIRQFPLFETLSKAQSNGLVHAYEQMTAPDS